MNDILSRRNFLRSTAGAISGAALLPTDAEATGLNEPLSLEQAAHALHQTVGRFSGRNAPFFDGDRHPFPERAFEWAMENLRYCSVDEIQALMKPLFEGCATQKTD